MAKILITGANSFVGKNFIKNSQFDCIEEICLIKNKVDEIDFSKYDTVIHVAAIVHQTNSIKSEIYFKINRDLCIEVANAAKNLGVKQFVFLSTVKVYGHYKQEIGVWTESSNCEPNDDYGKSKYEAELGLLKLQDENFAISIIRPPLIYGVGVKANMLSLIRLAVRFPILPLGGINNLRSFTSIENLVHLIDLCIKKRASGIFLGMDEKPLSTTELTKMIAKSLDKKILLFKIPGVIVLICKKIFPGIFDRLFGSFEINNKKTKEVLGYKPIISTQLGIDKMVKAYINSINK